MKLNKVILILTVVSFIGFASCAQDKKDINDHTMEGKIIKSEEEWKVELSPEEYHVLREKGTERAFSGKLYYNEKEGIYSCAACGYPLFSSASKYESGSGWPSFFEPYKKENLETNSEKSIGMLRDEVTCGRCGSHLGHVFNDGPQPTGLRYCINSVALDFEKTKE